MNQTRYASISAQTVEDLKNAMDQLQVRPSTAIYINSLIRRQNRKSDLSVAIAALNAIAIEVQKEEAKEGKGKVVSVIKDWTMEELRASFIEGLSGHVFEVVKALGVSIAALNMHAIDWSAFGSLGEVAGPSTVIIILYFTVHVATTKVGKK